MNTAKFLELVRDELELDSDLHVSTNLKELDEWDSMAAMVLIGLVSNEFDVNLTGDDINSITTVQSLIEKIGTERFE
ncbi:acyl carrier protein [Sphingobacterium siyangense]|uniref:Phosphopantetheine binding protein n=1 Tax=Sphingobacterium siyangense TaxID=459529 RepID=A0A562MJ93_9SPHI|nr:acyl carrier protein [Sphingobacterium siyangense]TWI19969.1 phosphopantetheine binding protein [Sphingobacterium siyangense]